MPLFHKFLSNQQTVRYAFLPFLCSEDIYLLALTCKKAYNVINPLTSDCKHFNYIIKEQNNIENIEENCAKLKDLQKFEIRSILKYKLQPKFDEEPQGLNEQQKEAWRPLDLVKHFERGELKNSDNITRQTIPILQEGQFQNDKLHGFGRTISKNGEIFCGQFEFGLKHGFGISKNRFGKETKGIWQNDKYMDYISDQINCLNESYKKLKEINREGKISKQQRLRRIKISYEEEKQKIINNYEEKTVIRIQDIQSHKIEIGYGLQVLFPVNPYSVQKTFVRSMASAILQEENALLESPTGTGKTLCLLTGALAVLRKLQESEKEKGKVKIIYTSRTFTQLQQVQQELKRTAYVPKTVILGSRDKFCINTELRAAKDDGSILRGNDLNVACQNSREKQGTTRCQFYHQQYHFDQKSLSKLPIYKKRIPHESLDIEELNILAENQNFCSFYHNRYSQDDADIIFMPYQFLLSKNIRDSTKINFENSIIIIDEAHNISEAAQDAYSSQINTKLLADVIQELGYLNRKIQSNVEDQALENFQGFQDEEQEIQSQEQSQAIIEEEQSIQQTQNSNRRATLKSSLQDVQLIQNIVEKFDDFLRKFDHDTKLFNDQIIENKFNRQKRKSSQINVSRIQQLVAIILRKDDESDLASQETFEAKMKVLDDLSKIQGSKSPDLHEFFLFVDQLKVIIEEIKTNDNKKMDEDFKLLIHEKEFYQKNKKPQSIVTLSLQCFNSSFCFKQIMGFKPRSLILSSGTLQPLDLLQKELGVHFNFQLKNNHVINDDQVQIYCLSQYAFGQNFDFTMKNRDNQTMILELGKSINTLSKSVGNGSGTLVFFTSYQLMQTYRKFWPPETFSKNVRYEDHDPEKMEQIFKDHVQDCTTGSGAILMGVCKARMSEGIDFSDDQARLVIVVGIPLANISDPMVVLKRKSQELKNNWQWLEKDALRAVNQAIGRVIRHKDDFGSIVLIEQRYTQAHIYNMITHWLNNKIQFGLKMERIAEKIKIQTQNNKERYCQSKNLKIEGLCVRNKKIALSGEFIDIDISILKSKGAIIHQIVNSTTDLLLVGFDPDISQTALALQHNVKVVSELEFFHPKKRNYNQINF